MGFIVHIAWCTVHGFVGYLERLDRTDSIDRQHVYLAKNDKLLLFNYVC